MTTILAVYSFTYMHQPSSFTLHNFPNSLKFFLLNLYLFSTSSDLLLQKKNPYPLLKTMACSSKNSNALKNKESADDAAPPTVSTLFPKSLLKLRTSKRSSHLLTPALGLLAYILLPSALLAFLL